MATKPITAEKAVRIVVVGDRGTGKSSLIISAAAEKFPTNVPPVLPPTRLPEDMFPDRVPVMVIDTSSSLENRGKLAEELKKADSVVLTYACDQPSTLDRLSTFWLPELRRLEVNVPVIVAGCKFDLKDEHQAVSLEQVMSPIVQEFREIEICIECSAYKHMQIPEVFYYSQKAVLHPTAPLFDQEKQTLKPRCVRALKRIFILCDQDRDGALSDAELNDFQRNEHGLMLAGFLFLHALLFENGRLETIWTVLRKFGYNNEIRLGSDYLLPEIKRTPDQSVELTSEALAFLRRVFVTFDVDGDDALNEQELEDVFSTAPESPWSETPYVNAAETDVLGGLSFDGFLSQWALMTLLNPILTVQNLVYIGYAGDPSSAVRVTRKRRADRKKQHSDRNFFQCFVFGPKEAGKSSLLDSFVGRPFSQVYTPTTEERYTVNMVDQPGGTKKTLILKEIPEDAIEKLLVKKEALGACDLCRYQIRTLKSITIPSNFEALGACDMAVFVHDISKEASWIRATELLVQVASHGESNGYEVPCLIVAAKDDLELFPNAIGALPGVSQDMGIQAPIPISTKLGDFNNVFKRTVAAAEHPHLSIPETEAGKTRKWAAFFRFIAFVYLGFYLLIKQGISCMRLGLGIGIKLWPELADWPVVGSGHRIDCISFIDNTLNLNLKKFKLYINYYSVVNSDFKSRVNSWIRYAASRTVEDVDLWLRDAGVGQVFTYDDELFFNNLCFNRVKVSYYIIRKSLLGIVGVEKLPDYRQIDVTSRSVKKLVFSDYYWIDGDYIDCMKVNAPYISSLTIKGEFGVKLVLLDVSSLIKAELDYSIDPGMSNDITHEEMLRGLLESLDHVKDVIINDFWWETLSSGGTVSSAIKATCVKEVDRIEKQFDDSTPNLLFGLMSVLVE
ncbi:mitochondrial Rho GTPase 1-like protein [Tanacetum coccineum]